MINSEINNLEIYNKPILCSNCNTKNDHDSIFCTQCGISLKNPQADNSKTFSNPLSFLFRTNPEYFFSLLTLFLVEILVFRFLFFDNFLLDFNNYVYVASSNDKILIVFNDFFNLILLFITFNELILVPAIFITRLGTKDYSRTDLKLFLASYLLKVLTLISIVIILELVGKNPDKWTTIIPLSCILILYPILLTKLLFFSDRLKFLFFKVPMNKFSKLGYKISTILLALDVVLVYMYHTDLKLILSTGIVFILFILFVFTDFSFLSKLFNEKMIKLSNNDLFLQIDEINSHNNPTKKIISTSDKIQLPLIAFLGVLFLISIPGDPWSWWYGPLRNFFQLGLNNYFLLVTILSLIFVISEIFFDVYYHKSSNIFLLALGIIFLDFSIFVSYKLYIFIVAPTSSKGITQYFINKVMIASSIPSILTIFIFLSFFICLLSSVLVFKSGKLSRINDVSFSSNKIGNVILLCCYLLFLIIVEWIYHYSFYSFYEATLTFFLGFSFLLLIKPFFNFINYFMIVRFKSKKSQTVGVKI